MTANRSVLLLLSIGLTLDGIGWMLACAGYYHYSIDAQLYEARWLLSTVLITGALALVFSFRQSLLFGSALIVALQYTAASCIVAGVLYAKDILADEGGGGQLSIAAAMVTISAIGLVLTLLLVASLYSSARNTTKRIRLARRRRQSLQLIAGLQLGFALFGIYVSGQMLALDGGSYVRAYMVQEIFVSLLLLVIAIAQTSIVGGGADAVTTRGALVAVVVANVVQVVQELTHAWSAYYVLIYLHSAIGAGLIDEGNTHHDQSVMMLNFILHCFRILMCAYTAYALGIDIKLQLLNTFARQYSCKVATIFWTIATSAGLLALLHASLDVVYYSMMTEKNIYRHLLASTGIAVFYAIAIAIATCLFQRTRRLFWIIIMVIFSLLLCVVSMHTLVAFVRLIYFGTDRETIGRQLNGHRLSTILYFVELLLAFVGLLFASFTFSLAMRFLQLHNRDLPATTHRRNILRRFLRFIAVCNVTLVGGEIFLFLKIKVSWPLIEQIVDFGILDAISTFAVCCLQFVIAYANSLWLLAILLLQLMTDAINALAILSAQTSYIQLIAKLYDHANQTAIASDSDDQRHQLYVIYGGHSIQVLQWILIIVSLMIVVAIFDERSVGKDNRDSMTISTIGFVNEAFDQSLDDPCTLSSVAAVVGADEML